MSQQLGIMPQFGDFQTIPPNNSNRYMPVRSQIQGVSGLKEAKAFPLMTNCGIILLDREDMKVYIKTTDDVGNYNVRAFKLTEVFEEEENNLDKYVRKDELQDLIASILTKAEDLPKGEEVKTDVVIPTSQPVSTVTKRVINTTNQSN